MLGVGAYELGQRDSCKLGELEAGIHSDPVPLSPEAQRLNLSSLFNENFEIT